MRPDDQKREVQPAIEVWLQSVRGLLSPMAESERSGQKEKDLMGAILSRCELAAKLMQKSFQNIQKPPPDILPKLTGIWGKEIIDSQFQLLEKMATFFAAHPGDGKEALNAWNTFYEKEVKPLLNLPQVGLARYYQERSNQLLDKFNSWNKASLEFLYMISGPLDESFCMLQREMEGGDQAKRFSEGMKGIYQVWVKQLESLYQNLFRSSEFIKCLSDTLDSLEDFVRARMEYMQDLGKALQLPTMRDLDEAYRELYLLKKEVHSIKKRKRANVTDS
jgi:hypothetical protein